MSASSKSPLLPFPNRGLYLITQDVSMPWEQFGEGILGAIRGGAAVVQYRAKGHRQSEDMARKVQQVCKQASVPLIINDNIDLAIKIGADGVHLGSEDTDITSARKKVGGGMILGVSCYDDPDKAVEAEAAGATYVAFGRFFPSKTKPNAPCARLETLVAAKAIVKIPVVAIGGITVENGKALIKAGAELLAVVEGVLGQDNPEFAAREFRKLWDGSGGFSPS